MALPLRHPTMGAPLVIALVLLFFIGGCRSADPRDGEGRQIFRIGFMPNLTHAPALLGLEDEIFKRHLGPDVVVESMAFVAGPSVIEGLFAGELDVAYVGPNPALNAFVISHGKAVRIIAGCTAGGAQLVVANGIDGTEDLLGKRLASPALANTQDVSLHTWLSDQGIEVGRGQQKVEVVAISPSDVLRLFEQGEVVGAWMPEPWASRLVLDAGGRVFVDERSLWPGGRFPTTVVIASSKAIELRPELVRRFLEAHLEAVRAFETDPARARASVGKRLRRELGFSLEPPVLERAYRHLSFTSDPMMPVLMEMADRAVRIGYLRTSQGIEGSIDTRFLP